MDGADDSRANLYRLLLDRFRGLESSHQNLKEQFQVLLEERARSNATSQENDLISNYADLGELPGWASIPGAFFSGSPYRSVLEYMGHAVHVNRIASGEIIYWNRAAEKLFGYKAWEAVGRKVSELRLEEEYHLSTRVIIGKLSIGATWSGQLPLRKRSGQIVLGMVTKSPLYENGELVGVVNVSSDASVFNITNSVNMGNHQEHGNKQSNSRRINLTNIQLQTQPRIAAVPHIVSSVSNLALRVLSLRRGDVTTGSEEAEVEGQDVRADKPPRAPIAKPSAGISMGTNRTDAMSSEMEFAKPSSNVVFSNLQGGAASNSETVINENIHQSGSDHNFRRKETTYEPCYEKNSMRSAYKGLLDWHRPTDQLSKSSFQQNGKEFRVENMPLRQSGSLNVPSSGEHVVTRLERASNRNDNDSLMVVNNEIRWKDLQLREEIGQGSFAVVYHGIWNGSDVAVKVYYGNQYSEETVLDYKKEIDIMRRLRHPNVLLFMGAVCTEEKLAMVTEYLIRGSLFKILHRNNQSLDIKRRLKMAIDVARGMNYLHHRNPPIVHRDLKSSNLLVDKSWTVKVGDFGLSKLKHATFLTAKSGRGTPQWMAPEVLRNEPSTEKSDIFSYGVILWEIMTERIPWGDLNTLQVVGVVGFMDRRLDLPESMDPQISSVISDCWQRNPEDRPSFEDILQRMTNLVHMGAGGATRTASIP